MHHSAVRIQSGHSSMKYVLIIIYCWQTDSQPAGVLSMMMVMTDTLSAACLIILYFIEEGYIS